MVKWSDQWVRLFRYFTTSLLDEEVEEEEYFALFFHYWNKSKNKKEKGHSSMKYVKLMLLFEWNVFSLGAKRKEKKKKFTFPYEFNVKCIVMCPSYIYWLKGWKEGEDEEEKGEEKKPVIWTNKLIPQDTRDLGKSGQASGRIWLPMKGCVCAKVNSTINGRRVTRSSVETCIQLPQWVPVGLGLHAWRTSTIPNDAPWHMKRFLCFDQIRRCKTSWLVVWYVY